VHAQDCVSYSAHAQHNCLAPLSLSLSLSLSLAISWRNSLSRALSLSLALTNAVRGGKQKEGGKEREDKEKRRKDIKGGPSQEKGRDKRKCEPGERASLSGLISDQNAMRGSKQKEGGKEREDKEKRRKDIKGGPGQERGRDKRNVREQGEQAGRCQETQ
jgi:hypothetical protein